MAEYILSKNREKYLPVTLSAQTHTFMPHLVGLAGMYCLCEVRPLWLTMLSSIAKLRVGFHTDFAILLKCSKSQFIFRIANARESAAGFAGLRPGPTWSVSGSWEGKFRYLEKWYIITTKFKETPGYRHMNNSGQIDITFTSTPAPPPLFFTFHSANKIKSPHCYHRGIIYNNYLNK